MKTRAAVLRDVGKDWEVIELDLDPPREGEVLIRFAAAGLCHSDDHLRTGDIPVRYPIVGGHEGAGIVEKVGPGVTRLAVGDHVVTSWLPVCGHCRFCSRGQTNLCDLGRFLVDNSLPDGTYRYHEGSTDFGQMCLLGTFSQYAVISEASAVKVEDDLPLDVVVLVGCGVPTGYGTAVKAGEVHPGDTTIIYGTGGVVLAQLYLAATDQPVDLMRIGFQDLIVQRRGFVEAALQNQNLNVILLHPEIPGMIAVERGVLR